MTVTRVTREDAYTQEITSTEISYRFSEDSSQHTQECKGMRKFR
jgi:hypothetical protein